jgi:hypothetical protein
VPTDHHTSGDRSVAGHDLSAEDLARAAADYSAHWARSEHFIFMAAGEHLLRLGSSRSGSLDLKAARDRAVALAADHDADLDELADLFCTTPRTARAAAERGSKTHNYRFVLAGFRREKLGIRS